MGKSVVALGCVAVLALVGGRPGDALGVPQAEMAGGIRIESDRDKPVDFQRIPGIVDDESAEPVRLPTDVTGGYLLAEGDEEDDKADEPVPVSGSWLLADGDEQESSTTDDPLDLIVIPPEVVSGAFALTA